MRATVTSEGRVTVPKVLRDYLGLRAGSTIKFERLPSGDVVLRPITCKAKSPSSVVDRRRRRTTLQMTTEDIMALTRNG
jgi:antitoxin PrlF